MAEKTILIAGGYGLVGSLIARHLRAAHPQLRLVLAGREPAGAATLATELGAGTVRVDVTDQTSLAGTLAGADLIIGALKDPQLILLDAAMAADAAFVTITSGANEPAPVFVRVLQAKPSRPIALMPYWMAGPLVWATLQAAQTFDRVDAARMVALYDFADPIGPMTMADAQSFGAGTALFRQGGEWTRAAVEGAAVRVEPDGAEAFDAQLMDALDVSSVAGSTGAGDVSFHLGSGQSLGTGAGDRASLDMYVDIDGQKDGAALRTRTTIIDPLGQANLTALGVVIAAERILGLDGGSEPQGGLVLPETLVAPSAAVARLTSAGVRITTVTR